MAANEIEDPKIFNPEKEGFLLLRIPLGLSSKTFKGKQIATILKNFWPPPSKIFTMVALI
jgi:hypothetical protein